MERVKASFKQVNDYLGKYSTRTKIMAGVGVAAVIVAAISIAYFLNRTNYEVLFSEVASDEAATIVSKLQEDEIKYIYEENGDILVDKSVVEQTRAELVYEGYPDSGFTYGIYIDNAGGMTTDAEKQQYELYALQERIGATIRVFDGVKNATVNIALAEEERYVLQSDAKKNEASASVVVTMDNGGNPSPEQAEAIQRLVAGSVSSMEMGNVTVIGGNGIEVSVDENTDTAGSSDAQEIAQLIESEITKKVINVLGPFYGPENIRVSATGTVNQEAVLRESITYSTPEKIDEEDKAGIVSNETWNLNGTAAGEEGGVVGTETNAESTQYEGSAIAEDGIISEAATKDYLVNQVIEQGEIQDGTLEDLTISVSINSEGGGDLSDQELKDLIGNATGIGTELRDEKITVVAAPFQELDGEDDSSGGIVPVAITDIITQNPLIAIIIGGVILLLIIIAIILGIIRSKKRKKQALVEAEEEAAFLLSSREEATAAMVDKLDVGQLPSDRTRELREIIRDFTEENPEISAQMLRSWINGESGEH